MALAVGACLMLAFQTQLPSSVLDVDFRGGKFRETILTLWGRNAKEYLSPVPEGLRISIPVRDKTSGPVGFATKLVVYGDFEITVSYEFLEEEGPEIPIGNSLNLSVAADSPSRDSAMVGWGMDKVSGESYVTSRGHNSSQGGQTEVKDRVASAARKGRLRLVRIGTTLAYSAARPDEDTFRELRVEDFVADPIKTTRVTVDPGALSSPLDVLIHSFQVHARDLSASASPNPSSQANSWVIVLAAAVALTAAGAYVLRRLALKRIDRLAK